MITQVGMYAAVRVVEVREWIDTGTIAPSQYQADREAGKINRKTGADWAQANPVVRIVRVEIRETETVHQIAQDDVPLEGTEYQFNSWGPDGRLVHCSPHRVNEVTRKVVEKMEADWREWAKGVALAHPDSPTARSVTEGKNAVKTVDVCDLKTGALLHRFEL